MIQPGFLLPVQNSPHSPHSSRSREIRRLGMLEWHSPSSLGSVIFAEAPRYRVTAGLPHCAPAAVVDLLTEFEKESGRARRRVLHFGIPQSALASFPGRGILPIGEAPVFVTHRWQERRNFPREIAAQARRAENRGIRIRQLREKPANAEALHRCLASWLAGKGLPPLGFLTDPFLLEPWPELGVWVAEWNGSPCGLLIVSQVFSSPLFRVDVMARAPFAPNGCMELLVATVFRAAAAEGRELVTLDLAPLSARAGAPGGKIPAWFRLTSRLTRRWGKPWYSFQGLEEFKAKFKPDYWLPLFCIAPGKDFSLPDGLALLRAFTKIVPAHYGLKTVLWRASSPAFRRVLLDRIQRGRES